MNIKIEDSQLNWKLWYWSLFCH